MDFKKQGKLTIFFSNPKISNVVQAYDDEHEWILLTKLPIDTLDQIKEIVIIYKSRWHIEGAPQAHKVMMKGLIMKCSKAVGKMMVGPSKSAVRSGFQTTPSGCH